MEAVNALLAGVREWEDKVAFAGSFSEKWGVADSLENAKAGNLTEELDLHWSGTLYKLSSLIRLKQVYPNNPVEVKVEGNTATGFLQLKDVSSEEITNGKLQIMYHPSMVLNGSKQAYAGYVDVFARDVGQTRQYMAGLRTKYVLSPLQFGGRSPSEILELAIEDSKVHGGELSVRNVEGKESVLEIKSSRPGDVSITRKIEFWYQPELPVIVSYEEIQSSKVANSIIRIEASDFVSSGAVLVPRKITAIISPGNQLPCRVKVWESPDLGDRMPTKEDFVLQVPEGTRVRGLNDIASEHIGQSLNISDISATDLEAQITANGTDLTAEGGLKRNWAIISVTVVVFVVLLVLVVQKQRTYRTA